MVEQDRLRRMISFRYSPLLDMALSLLVVLNPERFGSAAPWTGRVTNRLPDGLLEQLKEHTEQLDIFSLAMELEEGPGLTVPDALERLRAQHPITAALLLIYWDAIAPEVAGLTGLLAESIQQEAARLSQMDPLAFICRFSDRVSVAGDGEAIILHWGKGMRVPLADLERILFVPSAFSPRRLMFYRLDTVQIFFYSPQHVEPHVAEEPPESLLLGFSALADSTRMKLMRLIARESLPAQEMAQRLGVNESTISRHLRLLVEAGLVSRERAEGKLIFYSLHTERVDQLAAGVKGFFGRGERL